MDAWTHDEPTAVARVAARKSPQAVTEPRKRDTACDLLDTPIGALLVEATATGVSRLVFCDEQAPTMPGPATRASSSLAQQTLERMIDELRGYFESELTTFATPIDAAGTEFQHRVWRRMRLIRPGDTMSYGELAGAVDAPGAARAVGLACARNPTPIITPCHRVVGADGSLHGFAGGLWRKEWLLNHEGAGEPTLRGR